MVRADSWTGAHLDTRSRSLSEISFQIAHLWVHIDVNVDTGQAWDVAQGLSSYVRANLAYKATLEGLGVGDVEASAMAGALAKIARDASAMAAGLALAWGCGLVPDAPQYATLITELVDPQLVGTALVGTQALGYVCTMPSIFLMPTLSAVKAGGPRFEFAFLAPGAALSVLAMLRLERTQRRKRGPV